MNAKEKDQPLPFEHPVEKDCWPLYRLQGLPPSRFADVVGKVIDGRYQLLSAHRSVSAH